MDCLKILSSNVNCRANPNDDNIEGNLKLVKLILTYAPPRKDLPAEHLPL